jgi:outer membrane protein assembly factor BamB/tetratricopeptide (TPR) repeat protein
MNRIRRWAAVLGFGIIALAILGMLADNSAGRVKQPPIPPVVSTGDASGHSSVKIIEDSNWRRALKVGRDCIEDKEWGQAVEVLQKILALEKDFFVRDTERDVNTGKETQRWTSVKFAANNLLGSMKLEGLEVYEQAVGAEAKTKLDDAKKRGDMQQLAEVAQKYCHTKAGIEANEILATLFLARGQVFTAALRYEKIMQMNPEWAKIRDLTLFKAALAFRRAGDKKNSDETWARLQKILPKEGIKIGDQFVTIKKLQDVLDETQVQDMVSVHDWPSWRGNILNTAQANGSPPLLDTKLWSRPIFRDALDGFPDRDPDEDAERRVAKVIEQMEKKNEPVLPGFFPIVSQGVMVYRNHRGLVAVALKDQKIRDEESGTFSEYKAGQIIWKSIPMDRSLALLLEKAKTRAKAEQWMTGFDQVPGFASFLYDNTLIGTVMTDHRNVYAINDLAVPPHPGVFHHNQFNPQFNQYNLGELKSLVTQNELYAYDLITGKLKWDLNSEDKDFKDSHFLSLPITVAGKLYILNEKLIETPQAPNQFGNGFINPIPGESELRLVCIDPTKMTLTNGSPKPTILEPIQVLGNVVQHNRFVQDIGRRVNAVQLAYGEGILVCPTNAGEVFGIDLMTRSLVWSYPYRDQAHRQIMLPGMQMVNPFPGQPNNGGTTIVSKWKSSPPAIQDGRIVFTAPDADSIHCVNLRDGKPLWRKPQAKGDQYMAGVFKGKVVIVSDTSIRALDLKDGRQVWSIHTGDMPSGQGVASKDVYYLPLKKGEILAVDVVKGEIKAHNRAGGAGGAPGNLVFYDNMVLSQTNTEVAAYPQLSARLDSARLDSTNDPNNLTKLTDYGELLLKDGQVKKATEMLMKVYDGKPADPLASRAKQRLFEALTDLMHVDFDAASRDYLTVYEALCKVPDNNQEEQSRKARFFRLVGEGREAQGKLVEAFQMYKEFGALPMYKDIGIASPEDPTHKVPVNVWLRGRISGMMAKATAEQKEPLEAKITEEWKAVEAKKDLNAIRSFVGMFDVPFRVGREARVRLAETIMDRNERPAFLEAELSLYQVMGSEFRSDPATGGRALAALAQLEEKKGTNDSMRLAAAYYRLLKRDFEKDPVRGTKTGAMLFDELATDKRFLPFLEVASNPFGPVKMSARELGAGSFRFESTGFSMLPEGDQTPFARLNRLILDPSNAANPKLHLRDTNNTDRWTANLGNVPLNQQLFYQMYQQVNLGQAYNPNARFRFYQVKGHLIVCQVGVMVYCLDGDSGKKLWEMQTVEQQQNNPFVQFQQVLLDREGNPEMWFWNQQTQQRFAVPIGRVGAAQASYVAVLSQKGLTVVDPLRGTAMWKRPDVAVDSHVFGDDQYLFLADSNGTGGFGAGLTIRANDGEVLKVADFSPVYQHRIRTRGRQILAAQPGQGTVNVRLYDILSSKDIWSKQFPLGSYVLKTEDPNITGILDPLGQLTVLDVATGNVLVNSNVVQGRITLQDLKSLENPLLLQDGDRYYVALNKPIDRSKVNNGALHNNFQSGARSLTVNGWFLAVHRHDGKKQINDREITWKKGDLAWHSYMPITNQLLVVDQFEQSPMLVFSTRYNEFLPNGGIRWGSFTQSLSKSTGKMVYDSGYKNNNGQAPMFVRFQIDLKSRTVNLIGLSESVQHYADEGKGPPPLPNGAMLNPLNPRRDGTSSTTMLREGVAQPPIGINERIMRRPIVISDGIEVIREIDVRPITK